MYSHDSVLVEGVARLMLRREMQNVLAGLDCRVAP
jgi:hypothetical protein